MKRYSVGMITLLLECDMESAERLARTFSAMIPAVIDGVVRDAFVFNIDGSDDVERITEAAGATSLPGGELHSAFAAARADWFLCMEPGARLAGGWPEIVGDTLMEAGKGRATPIRFRPEPTGFSIRRLYSRPRALRCGLIIHKRQAEAARAGSLEALARGRATRQIAAGIIPAEF